MNELELLKLQVEALEKLVKIKDDTISALQTQITLKPAAPIQYVYWYYPYYNVIPSQWQQYPYQPHYYGGAGGTLQGQAGTGGASSGVVTFTDAVGQGSNQSMSLDGIVQTSGLRY